MIRMKSRVREIAVTVELPRPLQSLSYEECNDLLLALVRYCKLHDVPVRAASQFEMIYELAYDKSENVEEKIKRDIQAIHDFLAGYKKKTRQKS